jgi:hypothetical protein
MRGEVALEMDGFGAGDAAVVGPKSVDRHPDHCFREYAQALSAIL